MKITAAEKLILDNQMALMRAVQSLMDRRADVGAKRLSDRYDETRMALLGAEIVEDSTPPSP